MRRRDEIDALRALVNQPLEQSAKLLRIDGFPLPARRDFPILTVDAAQGAAAEKDRPRTEAAGNGRLLAVMEHGPRNAQAGRHTAEAGLPRLAVDATAARAEGSIPIIHKSSESAVYAAAVL